MTLGFWIILSLISKIFLYLGTIGAAGTVIFRVVFFEAAFLASKRLLALLILTAICASLSGYALRSAVLIGDSSGLTDIEMYVVLWDTAVGGSFAVRMLGLCLMLASLLLSGRGAIIISSIGLVVALWSFTQIGHATSFDTWLISGVFFLHFVAAAFWIGALLPILYAAQGAADLKFAAKIANRFGRIASIFVPLLIAAGIVLALKLLPDVTSLWTTAYGRILLAKIAVVACLLGLAAANKFRFVPAMERGEQAGAAHLAKSVKWEICAIFAVLTITAFLTTTVTLPEM